MTMVYAFGPDPKRLCFELETVSLTAEKEEPAVLRRDNVRVKLEPAPMCVLLAFLQAPGKIITYSTLSERFSPGSSDWANFSKRCVLQITNALDDKGCFMNHRGIGYSFIWNVTAFPNRPVPTPIDEITLLASELTNPRREKKFPFIKPDGYYTSIWGRDQEALSVLNELRREEGPSIVSLVAPPGFGKSAVFVRALRLGIPDEDPATVSLSGVGVFDAKENRSWFAALTDILGQITGCRELSTRLALAKQSITDTDRSRLYSVFFEFLGHAGKVWLAIENAEAIFLSEASSEFEDFLKAWCAASHRGKLLLITREPPRGMATCHRLLPSVKEALLRGLSNEASLALLRDAFSTFKCATFDDGVLMQIANQAHNIPLALKQIAGYLKSRDETLDLDLIKNSALLKLSGPEHLEDFILRLISAHLTLLDDASVCIVGLVAWADARIPHRAIVALIETGNWGDPDKILTRLTWCGLIEIEMRQHEDRRIGMHAIVRQAILEGGPDTTISLDLLASSLWRSATIYANEMLYEQSLVLWELFVRAVRLGGPHPNIARGMERKGRILAELHRIPEAIEALTDAVAVYRSPGFIYEDIIRASENLCGALSCLGEVLLMAGKAPEAFAPFEEGRRRLQDLAHDEPDRFAEQLAAFDLGLGQALAQTGKFRKAKLAHDAVIDRLN